MIMVKVKLAVVRKDGEMLLNGVYGCADDAAGKARRCQDLAKQKNINCKITCKFEEFDVRAINTAPIDAYYWFDRYEILVKENYHTKEKYYVVCHNNTPIQSGLDNPRFTKEVAEEYFKNLINQKVRDKKVFHITLADGKKLLDLAK